MTALRIDERPLDQGRVRVPTRRLYAVPTADCADLPPAPQRPAVSKQPVVSKRQDAAMGAAGVRPVTRVSPVARVRPKAQVRPAARLRSKARVRPVVQSRQVAVGRALNDSLIRQVATFAVAAIALLSAFTLGMFLVAALGLGLQAGEAIRVVNGDTLWSIAAGMGTELPTEQVVRDIMDLNGLDSAEILAGSELTLPSY